MSRIRSKNTSPECVVRSMLHKAGYRFRLHRKDLPGNPDIVLPKFRSVIFVHGCFWHQHKDCRYAVLPKTNEYYWAEKLRRNRERDDACVAVLEEMGWKVLVIWECELRMPEKAAQKLSDFLIGVMA